ncbi:MAG: isopenicillin N synthase family oxygenase [Deltaproteobacteria bacterium]|nr:isopenicillin N synthase family oxygenase [Deltaproteobacteria bacterium]
MDYKRGLGDGHEHRRRKSHHRGHRRFSGRRPSKTRFVDGVGRSLQDVGFFALVGHDVDCDFREKAYAESKGFFSLTDDDKRTCLDESKKGQRGFTAFGTEHAKGSSAADLKEFYQVGRVDVPDDHPVHAEYGGNIWPTTLRPEFGPTMSELYRRLDRLGKDVLRACALYLGEEEDFFHEMVKGGDTILRVIHYPAIGDVPAGATRAGAHEDINLITLLIGASAGGLELLQRDDTWLPVKAGYDEIVIDSGDMIQNLSNGRFKSTTHRVVVPEGESKYEPRFSIPCFIHPSAKSDLTPRPASVAATDGEAKYPSTTAGAYLEKRLKEIGLM